MRNHFSLPMPRAEGSEFEDMVAHENAIRTVIGFVVGGAMHLSFFWIDWQRFQQGLFELEPAYRWNFYGNTAWWLFTWIPIEIAWNYSRIRNGQYPMKRLRLLTNVIIPIAWVFPMFRAAINFQFNHALGYYMGVLVVLSLFILNFKFRLILMVISMLVMSTVVLMQENMAFFETSRWVIEVYAATAMIFFFTTAWYNKMVKQFLNEKLLEAQKNQLTSQGELLTLQNQIIEADKTKLAYELETANRQLTSFALRLAKKQEFLDGVKMETASLSTPDPEEQLKKKRLLRKIEQEKVGENDWAQFLMQFERVHPNFFAAISAQFPSLNTSELRLMALLKMNLNTKEISDLLGISTQSTNTARFRLKKHLCLNGEESLQQFVNKFG